MKQAIYILMKQLVGPGPQSSDTVLGVYADLDRAEAARRVAFSGLGVEHFYIKITELISGEYE